MSLLSKFSEGGWNIAYRHTPTGTILERDQSAFALIPNTWRSWAADPFVLEHEGITYIFAEIFDYITRRGAIGYTCCVNGKWKKWKTVIREPFHMSYPNVFSRNGQIYMVPETSEGHTLCLYRAVSFPDEWKLEKILATDVEWVDTTFFERDGQCCGITTDIRDLKAQKDILLRFDDQWNVLAADVISEKETDLSRSGGRIFNGDRGAVRVTQDCKEHYGGALVFSRFCAEELPDSGLGNILLRLEPGDLPICGHHHWTGLHTYNSTDHMEVVDVERRHYHLVGLFGRLVWRIRMRLAR